MGLYRKTDFYIELKQSYISYLGKSINIETKSRWKEANEQIKTCAQNLFVTDGSSGCITFPIQVIPIYERRKNGTTPSAKTMKELSHIHDNLFTSLSPKPNWSALWVLKNELVNMSYHESDNDRIHYYPVVIFTSRFQEKL